MELLRARFGGAPLMGGIDLVAHAARRVDERYGLLATLEQKPSLSRSSWNRLPHRRRLEAMDAWKEYSSTL